MNFKKFTQSVLKIFFLYILSLISFFISRMTILCIFGNAIDLQNYHADIVRAFITGFRYDTVVFTYSFLILFIMTCVPLKYSWFPAFYNRFLIWYASVVFFVLLSLQIGDFYFYKFFQSHFNLLVFGIVYDDTRAVLESVWTDYTVINILLGFLLAFALVVWGIVKIARSSFEIVIHPKVWQQVLVILLIVLLYGLGMRGSLGVFPIEKDDATISPNGFVNDLTMNGPFALKDAYSDNKRNKISTDTAEVLNKYGFASRNEVIASYTGRVSHHDFSSNDLLDTTCYNGFLEKNPPNVLFILMESWAGYYFDLHSRELNLLGSLEAELPYCYVFRNFTSCTNGTVHSLEGLMVGSPLTPLSQSIYMNKSLSSSVAKVFADKGYFTSFITGAKLGWRNLGKYVSCQYFQHVEGSSHLLQEIPGSESCEWGVYDEYLFERLFQQLSESVGKPLFEFAFTTTNHTPYKLPEHFVPESVVIPDFIKKKQRSKDEIVIKNLTAYQYANDCLGQLLYRIRHSEFAENTIVIVTGDHNTMALYDFSDRQLLEKYSVPLLMYIPDAYKPALVDVNRFGSHKDIFPTVFNIALSQTPYVRTGNNLFEESPFQQDFAINNYNTAFNVTGAVVIGKKPLYYKFNLNHELVPTLLNETPGLGDLERIGRAHGAALSLFIQEQVSQQ
jgi:phosphoglycerol transferase MdoB-like AlkP superfamily enzyme